jgi:hypothetical protein
MRILASLLLAIALSAPVQAAQRITFDPGGVIFAFIQRFTQWRIDRELVVIDGMCISACTLSIGIIPPDRLCVTPYARMAFHSATGGGVHSREGSRLVWMIYPQNVRELLLRRGWQKGMEHQELIYVEGEELHTIVRPCDALDYAELDKSKSFGGKE